MFLFTANTRTEESAVDGNWNGVEAARHESIKGGKSVIEKWHKI